MFMNSWRRAKAHARLQRIYKKNETVKGRVKVHCRYEDREHFPSANPVNCTPLGLSDICLRFAICSPTIQQGFRALQGSPSILLKGKSARKKGASGCQMKVKSFTYERNWTGKYYRQRLLPSMQTMDKHLASMLNEGWEVMTETSHSGNSRGFRPFAKRDTITISFRKPG